MRNEGDHTRLLVTMTAGIFAVLLLLVVVVGKAFFLPVFLSVLLALTFSPVVRFARKQGVPEFLSAGIIMVVLSVFTIFGTSLLSGPVSEWIERFPTIKYQLQEKLSPLYAPVREIADMSDQLTDATEPGTQSSDVQRVVIQDRGLLFVAASNFISATTTILITLVLTFFLLAKGRVFYGKIVQSFSSLAEKKEALSTVFEVEKGISGYLFAITMINASLGIAIGLAMWALGMPSPVLWGVMAFALNYLPYVGALMGVVGAFLVALITFDGITISLIVPLAYLAITVLEGQFITPTVVGRKFAINPVIVFLNVALWSWLWGLAGALIAVLLLVVFQAVASQIGAWQWIVFFISDDRDIELENKPDVKPLATQGQ